MATTMRAGDVTLHDLEAKFGVHLTQDATFFPEWRTALPEISAPEQQQLDRIQTSYLHLVAQTSMVEDVVKLVVVSPLLSMADFFLPPFTIQSEVAVEFSIADAEFAIEGKMDILVLHQRLWLLLIEAKRAAASLEVGLPQLLAYMLANPYPTLPVYGLITNGGSFVFLKLWQTSGTAHYALSRIFEMRNPGNDLYAVLAVLKQLQRVVLQEQPGDR